MAKDCKEVKGVLSVSEVKGQKVLPAQKRRRRFKGVRDQLNDYQTNRKLQKVLSRDFAEDSLSSEEDSRVGEIRGNEQECKALGSLKSTETTVNGIKSRRDVASNCGPVNIWRGPLGSRLSTESGITKAENSVSEETEGKNHEIYCHGPLLEAAQNARIYNDSKSFVDMKMKYGPDTALREFERLLNDTGGSPTDAQVENFVKEQFVPPGSEFEKWEPDDWTEAPKFLNDIADPDLKSWAKELNRRWKDLGRKISDDVATNGSMYSMIHSRNPIVVPGGRFREFYYWDNYWIVRGLLLSEMYSTVKGSLRNFLAMIEQYGFVPNGGRIYYIRRSQPPFLTLMVRDYVNATGDSEFVAEALPTLEKEYTFWMSNREVVVNDTEGKNHTLNRYASDVNQPRPESFREDAKLIANLSEAAGRELMTHITSACESGWDFSSRWTGSCQGCNPDRLLLDLRTRDVLPVDLNSILAAVEKTLGEFHMSLGNDEKANQFATAYLARVQAIEAVLWNEEDGVYYDYLISQSAHNKQFFASNVNPLWTKCYPGAVDAQERERRMYEYLQGKGVLGYPGGIPTSLNESGQQWDFPNAWPPLVHMIVEGMATSSVQELKSESFKQAQKWITSNWRGFNVTTFMFEKYDVKRSDGLPGGGGEYDVQEGFGWTNGVVTSLLKLFGDRLTTGSPIASSTKPPMISTTSDAASSTVALGNFVFTAAIASFGTV